MRILGFSKVDWRNYITHEQSKMLQPEFTTWRWPRKDRDWYADEVVSVVVKTRSPHRLVLGEAEIISVDSKEDYEITDVDAMADGFLESHGLKLYLMQERRARSIPSAARPNKITLRWLHWFRPMICYAAPGSSARTLYPSLFGDFVAPKAGSNA